MTKNVRSKILENLIKTKTTNNKLLLNNKNNNYSLIDEIIKQRIERTKKKYLIFENINTPIMKKKEFNNTQQLKCVNQSENGNRKRNPSANVNNKIYLTEQNFHQDKKRNRNKIISLYDNFITDIERENKIMKDIKNNTNRKIYSSDPYKDNSNFYFIDVKNSKDYQKFIRMNTSKNLRKKINKKKVLSEIKYINHQKLKLLSPENVKKTKTLTKRIHNNIKFYKKNLIDLFHKRKVWDKEYQERYIERQINLSEINSYNEKYRKGMKLYKISPSFNSGKNNRDDATKNTNDDLFKEFLKQMSINYKKSLKLK